MPSTILVVDDEDDIRELLQYNLEKEGYRVVTARDGKQALKSLQQPVDLCVLDVMMPEMDGWELSKAIRSNPKSAHVPIVFLTARDNEVDEVLGLELGAADYITKPVRMRTFIARIRRALKRAEPATARENETLQAGALRIHPQNYTVFIGKKELQFPKKEFEVLLYLARHPERVISRQTLLNEIWGQDVFVVDRTIDVHIRKIREKLEKHASYIETVKGVGYRFAPEE
jgi:two-component system, OmpR family, alkaline phosphatase synthesis response regulator PhoP